jgi:hypothetical protein
MGMGIDQHGAHPSMVAPSYDAENVRQRRSHTREV